MKDGFLRVASATPHIKVADCTGNSQKIIAMAKEAAENGASLVVFPELCITGYTCGKRLKTVHLLWYSLNFALQAIPAAIYSCRGLYSIPLKKISKSLSMKPKNWTA